MSLNRFDSIRNKYMDSTPPTPTPKSTSTPVSMLTNEDDTNPNILDQISAYSSIKTDVFIQQLNDELDDQRQINTILKQTDYDNNTLEIENFIENNSEKIKNQLNTIEYLFTELKSIYEENKELHIAQEQYTQTLDSDKTHKIASDMRKLKTMKTNIQAFLYQTGIRAQI